jgi:hypothetical protein
MAAVAARARRLQALHALRRVQAVTAFHGFPPNALQEQRALSPLQGVPAPRLRGAGRRPTRGLAEVALAEY